MNRDALNYMAERRELIGVFDGIKDRDYHGGPAFSRSNLKDSLERSVAHMLHSKAAGDDGHTKDTFLGSCFHTLMLQPERIADEWVTCEENFGTKGYDAVAAANPGKTCVPRATWEAIEKMRESVLKVPRVLEFLKGTPELSAYWYDDSGLHLKARPDIYHEGLRFLIDLKKTKDASPKAFARSCIDYGYDMQAAMALDGFNRAIRQQTKRKYNQDPGDVVDAFILVAVEDTEPYGVALYALGPDEIAVGRSKIQRAIEQLAGYDPNNRPPAFYPADIQSLSFPGWAYY